jgi:hypothetical protein
VDNDFHYSDNLTIVSGRHLLKMGANFIRYQQNRFYAGNNGLLGNFVYDGTFTGKGLPTSCSTISPLRAVEARPASGVIGSGATESFFRMTSKCDRI